MDEIEHDETEAKEACVCEIETRIERDEDGGEVEMALGPKGKWVETIYVDKKILTVDCHPGTKTFYLADDGKTWLDPYDSSGRQICYATLENTVCKKSGCKYSHDSNEPSHVVKKKKYKTKKRPANRYQILMDRED